jgi:PHD/YefM family antitoxin component YafN of YafNO toxin-antitoxin module
MKLEFPDVQANFIVDSQGQKKFVVLDVQQFKELMETLEDFYAIAQAGLVKSQEEETITLEELEQQGKMLLQQ